MALRKSCSRMALAACIRWMSDADELPMPLMSSSASALFETLRRDERFERLEVGRFDRSDDVDHTSSEDLTTGVGSVARLRWT